MQSADELLEHRGDKKKKKKDRRKDAEDEEPIYVNQPPRQTKVK